MEEKKVNEQELEKVSGGVFNRKTAVDNLAPDYFYDQFAPRNCYSCARQRKDCPYGDKADKIYEVYGPGNFTCSERVAK